MQAHDPAADVEQGGARFGELDPSAAPDQKLDGVAVLEFLHLGGNGGLTDVQRVGRSGEAVVFGDRMKRPEVCEYYSHSL